MTLDEYEADREPQKAAEDEARIAAGIVGILLLVAAVVLAGVGALVWLATR